MLNLRLLLAAILVTGLSLLSGCGKSSTSASDGELKILNFGNGAEPQDIDPQVVTGTIEHRIILALGEGLVSEDPDLKIIPGVAQTWDISDDGLVYTFHLNPDAKWSNGEVITPQDFVGR